MVLRGVGHLFRKHRDASASLIELKCCRKSLREKAHVDTAKSGGCRTEMMAVGGLPPTHAGGHTAPFTRPSPLNQKCSSSWPQCHTDLRRMATLLFTTFVLKKKQERENPTYLQSPFQKKKTQKTQHELERMVPQGFVSLGKPLTLSELESPSHAVP